MTADEELTERSESDESPDDVPDETPNTDREPSHLDDLEDGSGCTEIWEHLSERREADEE